MSTQAVLFTQTLLPVFFVLLLGYYAGRRGRIDPRHPESLIALLMQFALPCSLLLGIGSASRVVLRSQLPLIGLLLAVMLLTYALVFAVARLWLKEEIPAAAVLALTVGFANNVAIGFPLLVRVYGAPGQLAVMAGIVVGALVLSPLTLVLLEFGNAAASGGSPEPLSKRIRKALPVSLKRPVILAPALGLVLSLTGLNVPAYFAPSLDLLGKATIGLALFLTGLILAAQPFRLSKGVVTGVLFKNIAQPALMFLLLLLFHVHGLLAREAFLLACVPAGFFGTVFGARARIASLEASSTLVLSTLLAAVTLPAAIALAARIP